ncbi:hypothetical protein [Lactovum odontotermitis]
MKSVLLKQLNSYEKLRVPKGQPQSCCWRLVTNKSIMYSIITLREAEFSDED